MRLVGKFNRNNEFHDCHILIKYGKIQELAFDIKNPLQLLEWSYEYNSNFTIEKHYDIKNSPYNSNYFLKIYGGSKPYVIYLKLSVFDVFRLKWNSEKYLIQSVDMKKDILKYFLGGIFGFIFGILSQYINNTKRAPVDTPVIENQKSLEHK